MHHWSDSNRSFSPMELFPSALFLTLVLCFVYPLPARALGGWRKLARYSNGGGYFTDAYSRLLFGTSDLSEGRQITFQIDLVGYSVGAMEFDYSCSTSSMRDFQFESVIPTPRDGMRRFDSSSNFIIQKYKKIAATYYCENFSKLLMPDYQLDNGKQFFSPRIEIQSSGGDSQRFSLQERMTCLGARALKDLLNGYPAYFCVDIYRAKGWLSY